MLPSRGKKKTTFAPSLSPVAKTCMSLTQAVFAALCDALKRNVIAGAGIDPFIVEPATADNPLFKLDNILVSPHSAGVTQESMYRMGEWAAQNIVDCFDGKLNPDNVINKEVLG